VGDVPGALPDPPHDLDIRVPLLRQSRGPWLRCHAARHAPLHFSRNGLSRFTDPDQEFGVLYVADDFEGAFIETFGRRLDVRSVTITALSDTAVTRIDAARRLRLIDLASSGGTARLSADARVTSGSVAVAQRWARALWQHPIAADGLYYRLRHDDSRYGCAIFDRARRVLAATKLGAASAPAHRASLIAALDTYRFGLIPE
jgi:hypothetical protein